MTAPIPAGEPRKRPARSCLTCRKAKVRCEGAGDGTDTDVHCTRCTRMEVPCEFVPLRRFGRPRRLPQPGDADDTATREGVQLTVTNALAGMSNALASGSTLFAFDAPINFTIPGGLPLASVDPSLDDYDILAKAYLTQIHPFLPILTHHLPELSHQLRTSSPALSLALYSLLNPSETTGPPPVLGTTLSDLQAGVISVHCQYSQGQEDGARETLRAVCKTIVDNDWHQIDSPAHPGKFGMSASDVRSVRSLWWECWALDVLLAIVTGVRTYDLQDVPYQVQIGEDGDLDSPASLRIRALSLLVTCSKSPDETSDEAAVVSRMQALSTVASNLSILSHHSYVNSCGSIAATSPIELPRVLAAREAAFMASLISSASTIFLFSSSSYFSNLVASAFPCGLDTTSPAPLSSRHSILLATQNIFSLLRTSLAPQLPSTPHSPFFGCSLLVATQGRLLTLEKGSWDSVAATSDIELAEWVLAMQARRWKVAQGVLKEVQTLRLAVCGVIGSPTLLLSGA